MKFSALLNNALLQPKGSLSEQRKNVYLLRQTFSESQVCSLHTAVCVEMRGDATVVYLIGGQG